MPCWQFRQNILISHIIWYLDCINSTLIGICETDVTCCKNKVKKSEVLAVIRTSLMGSPHRCQGSWKPLWGNKALTGLKTFSIPSHNHLTPSQTLHRTNSSHIFYVSYENRDPFNKIRSVRVWILYSCKPPPKNQCHFTETVLVSEGLKWEPQWYRKRHDYTSCHGKVAPYLSASGCTKNTTVYNQEWFVDWFQGTYPCILDMVLLELQM